MPESAQATIFINPSLLHLLALPEGLSTFASVKQLATYRMVPLMDSVARQRSGSDRLTAPGPVRTAGSPQCSGPHPRLSLTSCSR